MLDISYIKYLFNQLIEKHNINRDDLYENGSIYYYNGNDGTDFDYNCNNMTCEFYILWKSEAGAIKCNQRGNKLVFFIYPKDNPYGGEYIEETFDSPFDLHELCEYLQGEFDDKGIYDEIISDWILEHRGYIYDESEYDE